MYNFMRKIFLLVVVMFTAFFGEAYSESVATDIRIVDLGEKTRIMMETGEPVDTHVAELKEPFRLIINFKKKLTSRLDETKTYQEGIVRHIRLMNFNSKAANVTGQTQLDAIVVELSDEVKYDIRSEGEYLYIDLFPGKKSKKKQMAPDLSQSAKLSYESAQDNYYKGLYALAKIDVEKVLAEVPSFEDAMMLKEKILKKIEADKEMAGKLSDDIASDRSNISDDERSDAQKLADALENKLTRERQDEENLKNYLEQGKTLYRKRRFHESLELLTMAKEIDPDHVEVDELMSKVREKIKEENDKSTEQSSGLSDAQISEIERETARGEEAFSQLDYALAKEHFENVLAVDPHNLKAKRYLARIVSARSEYVAGGGSASDVAVPKVMDKLSNLSLQDALKIGFANHLPSKISQEEVVLAREKVTKAKRALFPKVKLRYRETEGTTTGDDFKGEEYGAEFQQNLFSGGKYRNTYNQARVNLAVARKNYEKTKTEFQFEVTQAFYNLAFAKEKLNNKLALIDRSKELLAVAEKQFQAKALTLPEILDARGQLNEILLQTQQIQNDYDLAHLALLQLLSLDHGIEIDIVSIPNLVEADLNEQSMVNVAFDNRKDYQVKKLMVLYQKYALEIAEKATDFSVELTGSYGRRDEYFISENVDLQDEYFVGVKVSKPLGSHVAEFNMLSQDKVPQVGQTTPTEFDSLELALKLFENPGKSDLAEASISYHKAISELENAKRELVHDVRSSMFSVLESLAKIRHEKAQIAFAEEDLKSVRAKQQADQGTIVQVMRAEGKYLNSKTDLISAQADYYIAIARLNKDIGVHNYIDPSTGVISTDREGLSPGIQLVIKDKSENKPWYQLMPVGQGLHEYYPDSVVTDILKEKQEKSVLGKSKSWYKPSGWFGKKDPEMDEYKVYDEKYDFAMPNKQKRRWFLFRGRDADDDFKGFYRSEDEYRQAFDTEKPVKQKTSNPDEILATFEKKEEDRGDAFGEYLAEDKVVFAEYHVEDYSDKTVVAFRTNEKVSYSIAMLSNPSRMVISFRTSILTSISEFEKVDKGIVKSLKSVLMPSNVPGKFKDWNKLLSVIIEFDGARDYQVESNDQIFKIELKK